MPQVQLLWNSHKRVYRILCALEPLYVYQYRFRNALISKAKSSYSLPVLRDSSASIPNLVVRRYQYLDGGFCFL
jgi:hypothetical protein